VREQLLRIMQIRRRTAASRGRVVPNVLHLSCMHQCDREQERNVFASLPDKLNFLLGCERECALIWTAVTTTRHNLKTTIIKANSKEAVRKKRKKRVAHG